MHDEVKAALSGLASALASHPEDISELAVYGDMPGHLDDLMADLEEPEETPTVAAYASRLEDATGFTIEAGRKDGEPCWWLVDPYGDREGDPWFIWADLVLLMTQGTKNGRIDTMRPEHMPKVMGRDARVDRHGGEVYVYRRAGMHCYLCDSEIRIAEMQGRNLYWCPRCQKA